MRMSIRSKIILFFLVVMVASVSGFFILFFNQHQMYNHYVEELKKGILSQLEKDAEEVNTYFSYSEKIALDIATSGEQFLRLNKEI